MPFFTAALSALLALSAGGEVELPESPAARAWAGVGAETRPVGLAEALFAADPWLLDPLAADPELVWSRWGEWLGAEGRGASADPRRRAGLLVLAASQQRWEDAWAHFERLGAAPEWAAALLPLLVPGVPVEHLAAASGPAARLPEGVLLRPATPPRPASDPPTSLRPRQATLSGLRIGEAVVDLRVSLEPSGIEVDLLHVSGGPATLQVRLPEPPGQALQVEYIDWLRQDGARVPLALELLPGAEERSLFGRFQPRPRPMPALPSGPLPRCLARGGLWFETPSDDALARKAQPIARAIAELLGIPGGELAAGEPSASGFWNGTVVHLEAGARGLEKLIALLSMTEGFVLGGGLAR